MTFKLKICKFVSLEAVLTNCSGVDIPNHMYCYDDNVTGHSLECARSCPTDCMDDDTDTVCASDLGTYTGSCNMHKALCDMYAQEYLDNDNFNNATDALENITISSTGPCDSK